MKNNMFKNNWLPITLFILIVVTGSFFVKTDINQLNQGLGLAAIKSPVTEKAELPWAQQKHHTGEPFGGLVLFRLECNCPRERPGNYAVIVNDLVLKKSIWLKVDEKSKMYEYWHLLMNRYGLGTYNKGGTCYSRLVDPECKRPVTMDGTLNDGPGTGTSL